jgi:hypothetical protein
MFIKILNEFLSYNCWLLQAFTNCVHSLSLSIVLQPFGSWPRFQFLNPIHSRQDSLDGDQPIARPLPTYKTTQTRNKRTQISILRVEFEPTMPVFEGAKTVRALDHTATVMSANCVRITFRCEVRTFFRNFTFVRKKKKSPLVLVPGG